MLNSAAIPYMPTGAVRVSYLISTRNRAKFLAETLHNVREFITPEDELIIMDGASTDKTAEVVAANRDIVKLFVSELDRGEAHGINKGILASRGQYIKLLTDDDYTFPEGIRDAIRVLESNPDVDAILCGGESCVLEPTSGLSRSRHFNQLPSGRSLRGALEGLSGAPSCGLGLILRRRVIAIGGLFDTTFRAVDTYLIYHLLACKVNFRYAHIKLYRHTHYPHSASLPSENTNPVHVDGIRILLQLRRWDLLPRTEDWKGITQGLGLSVLPQGDALGQLVVFGECLRRSRLRFVLPIMASMVRIPHTIAHRIRNLYRCPVMTKAPVETEPDWDGSLR